MIVRVQVSIRVMLITLLVVSPGFPRQVVAQAPGPDSVATEFQSALRAVAWSAAVRRLHPEALDAFHFRMKILVESWT